jgi:O-methyltransferase involved in polyketide biosynthesis
MVAACRALETARPDGFVRDPYAERLAGERGMAIAQALPRVEIMCFGVGVRSHFLDELVTKCIAERSITTVLSVGCGLDSRPWRLELPAGLRWIEIDFPEMLDYKAAIMASETPKCRLERIPADLSAASQRQRVFSQTTGQTSLMITEGLLMYLAAETVEALASEPPAVGGIRYWLTDLTSPGFARNIGMDSYQSVQNMRAANHLDGLQILDTIQGNGWTSIERRSYLTDIWTFAGERIRAAMSKRPASEPPPPPLPPDDPTGVHLFGRACNSL